MSFLKYQTNKIYYHHQGQKNKPLVIYLHGGPGGYGMDLAQSIQNNYELNKSIKTKILTNFSFLTYDQIGCGQSTPSLTLKNNTIETNLDLLNFLIKKFSPKKPVILYGDSYGTQLALLYSLKYPEKVKKLLLTGLWLGSKKEVNSLYFNKAKKYKEVFKQIFKFNPTPNLCKKLHPEISRKKMIAEWNAWESFLGSNNKKNFIKTIPWSLMCKNEKTNPLYISIAFFESWYFHQDFYFNHQITKEDFNKIKCPIFIFQGINDEVCIPLPKFIKKMNNIESHLLSMGHLDMDELTEAFILSKIL